MPNHALKPALAGLAASLLPLAACQAEPVEAEPAEAGPALDLTGYRLTFEETFDTLDVSAWGPGTRWIAHTPWDGDFGDARFADPRAGFPLTLEDGILRIEATRKRSGDWQSGLLASVDPDFEGFTQSLGYFEMSAKFPEGNGTWPAFWLVGRTETHTAEIDIVEHYGKHPGRYSISVHEWDRENSKQSRSSHHRVTVEPGSLSAGYHTYGVDVGEEEMRFYFDRRLVWTHPTPALHKAEMAVLLNLAMGGASSPSKSTPDPAYMYVDHVRVWQRDDRLANPG